jgi:hypothetical protein
LTQGSKTAVSALQRLCDIAFYLVPFLVICAVWQPYYWAYRVRSVTVTDEMIRLARESPSDAVLGELGDFRFLTLDWKNKQDLIDGASDLLQGNLHTEGCSTRISIPFSARDFEDVSPGCDLLFAGFVVPDVWLQAYDASGRKEFLAAAQKFVLDADAYEQSALQPRGMLWNDHAVSARITVLANFWRLYRHSPDFQPDVARQILETVARSEELLAKPGQFTFATNHGVMQNLALWHATLAFPSLPRAQEYQQLASARLTDQMEFFVSDEGVVLEHSAGYHLFGLELFGMAFRYLDLMHQTPPTGWIKKYQRAEKFYAALRRPSGSLPIFGDTYDDTVPRGPLVTTFSQDQRPQALSYLPEWKPTEAQSVYPVSGYAVWWDGLESWPDLANLSQTVVAWSNFPSQSHKHADEMSVLFWAGGQNWLSNIGYWPYESRLRSTIESWAGADAPHLVGESPTAPRTTKLLASGSSGDLTALELERTGIDNYVARRQVIHYKPNFWLVLDNTSGPEKSRTSTTWTSGPDVIWRQQQTTGAFRLESPHDNNRLNLFFLASPETEQRLLHGSSTPFAGWQVEHSEAVPAFALRVEQPANHTWSATVWTWDKGSASEKIDGVPQMMRWVDATNWQMRLPGETDSAILRREGNMLRISSDHGAGAELELTTPADVSPAYTQVIHQFEIAEQRYPVFSANPVRRKKVTYVLLGVFLLQQIFFLAYRRLRGPRLYTLKWLNVVVWIVGGIWLVSFYL